MHTVFYVIRNFQLTYFHYLGMINTTKLTMILNHFSIKFFILNHFSKNHAAV